MKKKVIKEEENPFVVLSEEASALTKVISPLDHADTNTIKVKINEIIDYLNGR